MKEISYLHSKIAKPFWKPHKSGKLFVIEGIDGAGGETQSKLLVNYLKKQKKSVERLRYPDYGEPIGKLIHNYLHRKYNFSVGTQILLYLADFLKDKEKIERWLREKKIIICDRYFTSTIAYQGVQGFPMKKALRFAELVGLPKPDLVIYLKISPETSMKRKYKEKKCLDRNEANKKLQTQLSKFYQKLVKNQIFGKWQVIDGEKSIEEVFKKIQKIYEKYC